MARVTVEDCILKIPNRFELVMLAAQRARDISAGAQLTVDRDNDKHPVIALREIADGTIATSDLKDALVRDRQRIAQEDEPDDEVIELMAGEEELYAQASAETAFGSDDPEAEAAAEGSEDAESAVVEDGVDDDVEISPEDIFSDPDSDKS